MTQIGDISELTAKEKKNERRALLRQPMLIVIVITVAVFLFLFFLAVL